MEHIQTHLHCPWIRWYWSNKLLTITAIFLIFSLVGCVQNSNIKDYKYEMNAADYKPALQLIRLEIDKPNSSDPQYMFSLYCTGIKTLSSYQKKYGNQPNFDAEAKQYYEKALIYYGQSAKNKASLNHIFAEYLTAASRYGSALSYLYGELKYWEQIGHEYQIISCYDLLATSYGESGRFELEDHYRIKLLKLAEDYFVFGKRPIEENEWIRYASFIKNRMADLAERGSSQEILDLWSKLEPIVIRYFTREYLSYIADHEPQYLSYLTVAKYLSEAGDHFNASLIYHQGSDVARQEKELSAQTDLFCYQAAILYNSGHNNDAISNANDCFALYKIRKIVPTADLLNLMGLLNEAQGNIDLAIKNFRDSIAIAEKSRSSYTVAERAAFFRSNVRQSYWGLIRCLTNKAISTQEEGDFWEALRTTEILRSRQFGDLQGEDLGEILNNLSMSDLRKVIAKDEIVLSYLMMRDHIVLFALTQENRKAVIIPYARDEFRNQILSITRQLANPVTDYEATGKDLIGTGDKLINDVRSLIRNKTKILVLLDGILNVLPFDLLSLENKKYQPIILEKAVMLSPSLRYIIQMREAEKSIQPAAGLFALADPVFDNGEKVFENPALVNSKDYMVNRGFSQYFSPLPETREEINDIATLFENEPVKKLLGGHATESELKKTDLTPYGILHFATHGILGDDLPIVNEPSLVMSQEPDEDGFFTASEAAELKLRAELTILSACNTGMGEYFVGEGLISLSRAFLIAGSRKAMVSLWSVPSEATKNLMVDFYKHYKSGVPAVEALRKAKLKMMALPDQSTNSDFGRGLQILHSKPENINLFEHPFFWSAFVLIGS